jgi:drug/metabolite transporter (DMT)-like permease
VEGAEVLLIAVATVFIGSADLFGGLAARRSSPLSSAAWSQAIGVPLLLAVALVVGGQLIGRDLLLGVAAGCGAAIGVGALYIGFTRAAMGVVAPTAATVAAGVPIIIGIVGGERPSAPGVVGLALAVVAIVAVGFVPGERPTLAGVAFGCASGVGFGAMVIAYAATTSESGLWSAVAGRTTAALLAGVAVVAMRTDWRLTLDARLPAALSGLLAALGMAAFVTVSQTADLVVLGVALGLFPAMTVLLAAVFLGERLAPTQWAGVAAAAVAVALITVG